jgi:hypothetical protein
MIEWVVQIRAESGVVGRSDNARQAAYHSRRKWKSPDGGITSIVVICLFAYTVLGHSTQQPRDFVSDLMMTVSRHTPISPHIKAETGGRKTPLLRLASRWLPYDKKSGKIQG